MLLTCFNCVSYPSDAIRQQTEFAPPRIIPPGENVEEHTESNAASSWRSGTDTLPTDMRDTPLYEQGPEGRVIARNTRFFISIIAASNTSSDLISDSLYLFIR
jgi:hypothetical protein